MKTEIRNKLILASAGIALMTTSVFVACGKDTTADNSTADNNGNTDATTPTEERLIEVNEKNADRIKNASNTTISEVANKFSYKADNATVKDELSKAGLTDTGKVVLNAHQLYVTAGGKYHIIDKGKAYELIEENDTLIYLEDKNGYKVFTGFDGDRTLVFGSQEAYQQFIDEIHSKLSNDSVCTIINDVFVANEIASQELTINESTHTYYDLTAILDACIECIKQYDYLDPITYTKNDDGSISVTRTIYNLGSNHSVVTEEKTIEVVIGEKGKEYYDSVADYVAGATFIEDDTTWIDSVLLSQLLGIDTSLEEYIVPGTEEAYKALMVDTANGMDTPEITVQTEPTAPLISAEEPAISETPVQTEEIPDVTFVPQFEDDGQINDANSELEDWQIRGCDPQLHELGIDIVISGTTEEKEQIYHDALVQLFGSDVNVVGTGIGVTDTKLIFELSDLPAEEREQMYQDFLAGRDWHDISDAELVANYAIIIQSGHNDIVEYLTGKYDRQYNDTTWTVL